MCFWCHIQWEEIEISKEGSLCHQEILGRRDRVLKEKGTWTPKGGGATVDKASSQRWHLGRYLKETRTEPCLMVMSLPNRQAHKEKEPRVFVSGWVEWVMC